MTQYLEVNFDNLTEELAACLPPESPAVLRQHDAASHLRLVIRLLIRERGAGGDPDSASALVEHIAELSLAEKVLLRRRMADIVERTRPPAPTAALAPTSASPNGAPPDATSAYPQSAPPGNASPGPSPALATAPVPARPDARALPGRRLLTDKPGLGTAGVQSVLQALSTKALELLRADICQVYLDDGDLLVLQAEAPDRPAPGRGQPTTTPVPLPDRLAPGEGFAGMVRSSARALAIAADELREGAELAWVDRGAVYIAAVPVGSPGDAGSGMLVALRVTPREFGRNDLVEMARLADEVTLAMASADLLSRAEELAVLKERMKLAREIHDGLASDLSAVVQMFKYHEHRRRADPADADALLVQMRELVEGALQSARDILSTLRPRQQTPRRLAETIKQLLESFSRTYGVSGTTRIVGDDSALVAEEREAIFQVVREALTNIRKHSQAATIHLTLDMTQRPFVLVVEDDGVGIDMQLAEDKSGSFGLLGMRERAQLLGGTLYVSNGIMGGVRLEFHGPAVPLGA